MKFLFINDNSEMLNAWGRVFGNRKDTALAECHSVEEALRAVTENQPEVVFLDHELTEGGNEGLEIARQLKGMKIYSTTMRKDAIASYKELGIDHIDASSLRELKSIFDQAGQEIKPEREEGRAGKRK